MRTRHLKRATAMALLYFSSALLLAGGVQSTVHAHGDHTDDLLTTACNMCASATVLAVPADPAGAVEPLWSAFTPDTPATARPSDPRLRPAFEPRAPPRF